MSEDLRFPALHAAASNNPHRTVLEFVVSSLREAILSGALPGGSHLVQSAIAKSLNVSTTPVREALRDLAGEGLVIMDDHRGGVVRQFDYAEVRDIYEIRTALEPLLIRRTVERITEAELAAVTDLKIEMDGTSDVATWVLMNRRFHHMLAEAARWPLLADYLQSLQTKATIYVGVDSRHNPGNLDRGKREHEQILDACRERDAEQAAFSVQRHVQTSMENLLQGHFDESAEDEPPATAGT